jgi:hypothetical protein
LISLGTGKSLKLSTLKSLLKAKKPLSLPGVIQMIGIVSKFTILKDLRFKKTLVNFTRLGPIVSVVVGNSKVAADSGHQYVHCFTLSGKDKVLFCKEVSILLKPLQTQVALSNRLVIFKEE